MKQEWTGSSVYMDYHLGTPRGNWKRLVGGDNQESPMIWPPTGNISILMKMWPSFYSWTGESQGTFRLHLEGSRMFEMTLPFFFFGHTHRSFCATKSNPPIAVTQATAVTMLDP